MNKNRSLNGSFFYFIYLLIKTKYYNIYEINDIMANGVYLNINYPFKDSLKGFFLDLTEDDNKAIKADLLHLLLTRKGQRLYNPEFGTRLLEYIYEPYDELTFSEVREEIDTAVKTYLPQVNLTDLSVEPSPLSEYAVLVTIQYTITDNVFEVSDIIQINL
jgi:phage baseplate assembly protein W